MIGSNRANTSLSIDTEVPKHLETDTFSLESMEKVCFPLRMDQREQFASRGQLNDTPRRPYLST